MGLAECLRVELAETAPGVHTTLVCPWYVDTGMFEGVQVVRLRRLTAILKEEEVAEKVLRAVERNQGRLYMPWLVYPAAALRALPAGIADRALSALGVFRTMEHFVGRNGRWLTGVGS